jgi:hypothetical protein
VSRYLDQPMYYFFRICSYFYAWYINQSNIKKKNKPWFEIQSYRVFLSLKNEFFLQKSHTFVTAYKSFLQRRNRIVVQQWNSQLPFQKQRLKENDCVRHKDTTAVSRAYVAIQFSSSCFSSNFPASGIARKNYREVEDLALERVFQT